MHREITNLKFLKPTNNKDVVLLKKFFCFVQRVYVYNRHTSLFLDPDHNLFPEYMEKQANSNKSREVSIIEVDNKINFHLQSTNPSYQFSINRANIYLRGESASVSLRSPINKQKQCREALNLEGRGGFWIAISIKLRHQNGASQFLE